MDMKRFTSRPRGSFSSSLPKGIEIHVMFKWHKVKRNFFEGTSSSSINITCSFLCCPTTVGVKDSWRPSVQHFNDSLSVLCEWQDKRLWTASRKNALTHSVMTKDGRWRKKLAVRQRWCHSFDHRAKGESETVALLGPVNHSDALFVTRPCLQCTINRVA